MVRSPRCICSKVQGKNAFACIDRQIGDSSTAFENPVAEAASGLVRRGRLHQRRPRVRLKDMR